MWAVSEAAEDGDTRVVGWLVHRSDRDGGRRDWPPDGSITRILRHSCPIAGRARTHPTSSGHRKPKRFGDSEINCMMGSPERRVIRECNLSAEPNVLISDLALAFSLDPPLHQLVSGVRVILGDAGQHNRSAVRERGHQRQVSAHRLYGVGCGKGRNDTLSV